MGVVGWWSQRPWIDYVAAGAALGVYRILRSVGLDPIVVQPGSYRVEIYQGTVTIASAVLAFAVVPAAIVLALTPGRRLRYLLREHPDDLRRATVATGLRSLASLAAGVSALALDAGDASNGLVRHLAVFSLGAELLAAVRLIDLFSLLLKNVGRDTEMQEYDPTAGPIHPVKLPDAPGGADARLEMTASPVE